ncbi:sugar ABC transporter permease [Nonomuraea sediminis]|uniref:sugar ABC transporter permease n=1 Tax=Nonomuraea sediminis TaxID=2835864 RepID=UPI001BDC9A11|nr:sugar ABC transporter permease [Nonomuraea sediminis]
MTLTTDRQDERLQGGIGGAVADVLERARGGDLGMIPVVVGLVVIWTVLQILNPIFLSSANLVNLLLDLSAIGIVALGIVCVLLVGQIDLSVGSVGGFSGAVLAILFVTKGWPVWAAIPITVAGGAVIGWIYAQLFNRFGVPSFVITLAGLLTFLGLQIYVLGTKGAVNLPFDSGLVNFAQLDFVPPWLSYALVIAASAWLFVTGYLHASERRKANLSARGLSTLVIRSAALLVGLGFVVWYLNQTRGVGWLFMLFLAMVLVMHYLLSRTKWGRAVYAIGGNVEAARRAGINVKAVYTSVFVLCSTFAAVGGILVAARLAAANQSNGTGDFNLNAIAAAVIGGTSLFGGRGTAFGALLGMIVIQSISSGLTLLSLDSSIRYVVTGIVLLLAVVVDSIARKSRTSHGRA